MAKILIVEDDCNVSANATKLLESKGHAVRVESNGAAALLAAHADLPDLIIMDLVVPILDGHEILTALRSDKRTAHIPIVMLAAHGDDRTMADALVGGANVFLTKPVDPKELCAAVERLTTLRRVETSPS